MSPKMSPVSQMMDSWFVTDEMNICQLLHFSGFYSLQDFWRLDADSTSTPPTSFQPPEAAKCKFQERLDIPTEMRNTLIARYWKAASTRSFGNPKDIQAIEVCLNNDRNCHTLIAGAKAFFANEICAYLPAPVLNILSMSAAVTKDSMQLFHPTALFVLYPEDGMAIKENSFDFRSGTFTPLSGNEAMFAEDLQRDGLPAL